MESKAGIYKERHMNQVLFETGYMGDIRGNMLLISGFGGLLLFYLKMKSDAKTEKREEVAKLTCLAAKGLLACIVIGIAALIKGYKDIVISYKSGNYVEIEGVVEDYYEEPYKGYDEYFTIDGVRFECSYGSPMWGYQKQRKNEIIISGRHLKIRYIPFRHENVIVYIEQMVPEEWETD